MVVRAAGYVSLIVVWAAIMLTLATGAFLDPALDGQRDPDWMFWVLALALGALIARAPFVGVVVSDGVVRRRTWLRTQTWRAGDVHRVGSSRYSGALTRYAPSKRYRMVVITLRHGRGGRDIPELSGRPDTVERCIAKLNEALDIQSVARADT